MSTMPDVSNNIVYNSMHVDRLKGMKGRAERCAHNNQEVIPITHISYNRG